MTDPRDPLAGLDPYPRELIETLAPHPERADLLEDIVSTPSPARPSPARTRALLALGVAAAVAIIGGGWFLASGGSGNHVNPVAATSPAVSITPSPSSTTASTKPSSMAGGPNGVVSGARCRKLLARNGQLRQVLPLLQQRSATTSGKHVRLYVKVSKNGHRYAVLVGPGCKLKGVLGATHTGH